MLYASNYKKINSYEHKVLHSLAQSTVQCNKEIHLKAKKYWHHFKNVKLSVQLEEAFIIYTLEGFSFTSTNMFTIWNEDELARQQP